MVKKRAQISFEYLIIVGFVTLIVSAILAISILYTSGLQDGIKMNQMGDFANKIISTSEYIFYAGAPSKATITVYLPKDVKAIEISENSLIISIQTSSGLNKIGFPSKVNISGVITTSQGLKEIEIIALDDSVSISQT